MLLVVEKKHRLAIQKTVKLEDMKDEQWFLFDEGSGLRKPINKLFAGQNFKPKKIYSTNDGSLIRNLVIKEGGVAFLPD